MCGNSLKATMTSAAGSLAATAAAPPVHAPLALDEVSTTAAARLTEHGGVLSSRASDGAAVLTAAAQAVAAVSTFMAETDLANAASLVVGGQPAAVAGRTFTGKAAAATPSGDVQTLLVGALGGAALTLIGILVGYRLGRRS